MTMDGDWLMLVAILFFVLILSLKAYFLGVVWACYKYLSVGGARGMGRGNARQFSTGVDAEVSDTVSIAACSRALAGCMHAFTSVTCYVKYCYFMLFHRFKSTF